MFAMQQSRSCHYSPPQRNEPSTSQSKGVYHQSQKLTAQATNRRSIAARLAIRAGNLGKKEPNIISDLHSSLDLTCAKEVCRG
eukprot:3682534-Pleurochrysis_carterae.AAC.1